MLPVQRHFISSQTPLAAPSAPTVDLDMYTARAPTPSAVAAQRCAPPPPVEGPPPPPPLICPKAHTLFLRPVLHTDGRTYERAALAAATGLAPESFVPNFAVQRAAEAWRRGGAQPWLDVAAELECALTLELLPDNFITCRDGWSYDPAALGDYFARGGTRSPRTRQDIAAEPRALKNTTLRDLLRAMRQALRLDALVLPLPQSGGASSIAVTPMPPPPRLTLTDGERDLLPELQTMASHPARFVPEDWLHMGDQLESLAKRLGADSECEAALTLKTFCAAWLHSLNRPNMVDENDLLDALPCLVRLRFAMGDMAGTRAVLEELRAVDTFALHALGAIAARVETWWGRSLIDRKSFDEAAEALVRALAYAPTESQSIRAEAATAYRELGFAYADADCDRLAIAYFEQSLQLVPEPPNEILTFLATAHARCGNTQASRQYYARLHNLRPAEVHISHRSPARARPSWLQRLVNRL